MKSVYRFSLLFILLISLAGCLYRPAVQQGNILPCNVASAIHVGMTQDQVRSILGTPVLRNPLNSNRWDYVYTNKQGGNPRQEQRLTLLFTRNGVLQSIQYVPLYNNSNH